MLQEFAQQVEFTARTVMNDIHTALPGKIVSFDPEKGVAAVQPKGKYLTTDGASLAYPMISSVPVAYPYCQSSNVGMVFPIKTGDNCLIIISEVELDEWRSGAESEAPLRYDLTSAVVIPDLMLGGGTVIRKAAAENAVIIVSGSSEIAVTDGRIAITGDVTVTGSITISGTITAGGINLNTHTHTGVHGGTSGPH